MPNRPFSLFVPLAAAALIGCGGGAPAGDAAPAAPDEWRFGAQEHIALWYHGLAVAGLGADGSAALPFYRADYGERVREARRQRGGTTTALSGDPQALAQRVAPAAAASGFQFLPLYFDNWNQLLQAVDVWQRAGGDPNRVAAEAASVVAFLSSIFPNASQRAALVDWIRALENERTGFFEEWWRATAPTQLAGDVQQLWEQLRPDLLPLLRYSDASSGIVSLTPALRGEGRMDTGRGFVVAAVGARTGEDPRAIVGRLLHELAYPIAAEAVRDAVAPARIREIGEDVLVARAAVRAGSMIVERVAPGLGSVYEDDYLRAAGVAPVSSSLEQQYPLPPELVDALETGVRLATAGI